MVLKETQRLLRRVVMLAVLTTGLVFAASGLVGSNAGAAICCDQCFINFDNCLAGCNGNSACEQSCNNTLVSCHRFCDSGC
jgi:hypothetical protein